MHAVQPVLGAIIDPNGKPRSNGRPQPTDASQPQPPKCNAAPSKKYLQLHEFAMDGPTGANSATAANPHVLQAMNDLQSLWSGEFDAPDSIDVLRRISERLTRLAEAIEKSHTTDMPDA